MLVPADAGQSGEQPLQSPAFLGGAPFIPTSVPSLSATLDTDAGPGDDSKS